MGADEKHDATYHGREYTPATENVEHSYVAYRSSKVDLITGHHEFTRWLETVRAEAKAEALREAAHDLFDWVKSPFMCLDECGNSDCPDDIRLGAGKDIQKWLRARANQYKEGVDSGR